MDYEALKAHSEDIDKIMPPSTVKNIQGRRTERARAFQVVYSLFFSPVDSARGLGRRYLNTLYAEPLDGFDIFRESECQAEDEDGVPIQLTYPKDDDDGANIIIPGQEEELAGFTWELVLGVWQKQSELDKIITEFSQNWRLERMGRVELALLRLAVYELVFSDQTPPKVIINEAIELSKQFGDDNSRGFVNGILDAAVKAVDSGAIKRAASFWGH